MRTTPLIYLIFPFIFPFSYIKTDKIKTDKIKTDKIKSVAITNKSGSVYEGTELQIECRAEAFSKISNSRLVLKWTLDGEPINPTRISRIKITYKGKRTTQLSSTLQIVDSKESDRGIVCYTNNNISRFGVPLKLIRN